MNMVINREVIIVLVLYFAVILIVGFYASGYNKSLSDYMLGGRRLGATIAAMGVAASDMSGWLLLGLPGAAYAEGLHAVWLPMGLIIGAYINWRWVARRLRIYTEVANDSLTIPAYFDNRLRDDSKILRAVTALVVLIFFAFYAAAGFVGGAILFESTFHLTYHTALMIGAAVIIIYTTIGGFLAVNWVDLFQGTLMLLALIVVPLVAMLHMGGVAVTFTEITRLHPDYNRLINGVGIITILSLLSWGLGYFGQPHILVRFMASKNGDTLIRARRICMTWMVFSLVGAMMVGIVGIAFFGLVPLKDPETVFLKFTDALFDPWMAGFLLSAVLSAIMSTIAAQLLASASAISEDFYRSLFRPHASNKELVIVSRISVLIIALLSVYLARDPKSTVLHLVGYAWAGLGASFGPVILFSLYWRRMNAMDAIAGMIVGAITVIIWKNLYNYGGIFTLYEMIPGFIAACGTIIITSRFSKPPPAAVMNDFDKVHKLCKRR